MDESLFGITTLNGKDYTYKFESGFLYINFGSDFHEYVFQNTKDLPWEYIDGIIDRTAKVVRFLICKNGYGSSMQSSFFSSFSILIRVKSYLILNQPIISANQTRITLSNNKFPNGYHYINILNYNLLIKMMMFGKLILV